MVTTLERWASRRDRAILFDFNGTLSNDEPILFRLYVDLVSEHFGAVLSEDDYFASFVGLSDREIFELLVAQHNGDPNMVTELLEERSVRYLELAAATSPIEDGSFDLVQCLLKAKVPLGIVTGAPRKEVSFVLEHRGLGTAFGCVVTEEDVTSGKPDPEGYLKGAGLLGIDPASILVFEDSLYGLRAAHAAGMTAVAVTGSSEVASINAEADLVVGKLEPSLFDGVLL